MEATCNGCAGKGIKLITRQMGHMIQQMQAQCEKCRGTGSCISEKDKCQGCHAKKVTSERKVPTHLNSDTLILLSKTNKH